jgi:hypothetical protein
VLEDDNIDRQHPDIDLQTNKSFNEYGHFRHRVNVQHLLYFNRQDCIEVDQVMDQCIWHCQSSQDDHLSIQTNKVGLMKKNPDFSKLRPFFGWLQPDVIKKTFEKTTHCI